MVNKPSEFKWASVSLTLSLFCWASIASAMDPPSPKHGKSAGADVSLDDVILEVGSNAESKAENEDEVYENKDVQEDSRVQNQVTVFSSNKDVVEHLIIPMLNAVDLSNLQQTCKTFQPMAKKQLDKEGTDQNRVKNRMQAIHSLAGQIASGAIVTPAKTALAVALNLNPLNSSREDLGRAYRRMILTIHPDRAPRNGLTWEQATERTQALVGLRAIYEEEQQNSARLRDAAIRKLTRYRQLLAIEKKAKLKPVPKKEKKQDEAKEEEEDSAASK